jgi:hypothetical protein
MQQPLLRQMVRSKIMPGAAVSIADNLDFLRHLPKPNALQNVLGFSMGLRRPGGGSPLQETPDFGANPGNLTMLSYVPEGLTGPSPLVDVGGPIWLRPADARAKARQ